MTEFKIEVEYIDHSTSAKLHEGTIESALADVALSIVEYSLFDPINIRAIRITKK